MKSNSIYAGVFSIAVALASPHAMAEQIELVVDYPYPGIFKGLQEDLANRFAQKHPDIRIKFTAPATDYEQGSQRILLQAVTKQLPDVSFQGLNRQRVLVDRGIAVDLSPFIQGDRTWKELGLNGGLLRASVFSGKQFGVPFAVSTPVVYINEDLLTKAGVNLSNLPTDWQGYFELAKKVNQLGQDVHGFRYDWDISGNWLWQALVFSHGGSMTDTSERKVAFTDEAGMQAIELLGRMKTDVAMKDIPYTVSLQDFIAGRLAIWVQTTAFLGNVSKQVGDRFRYRTAPYPIVAKEGRIPAGGNAIVMLAKDKTRQDAAWKYITYLVSPEAATAMVQATGYFSLSDKAARDDAYLGKFYREHPNHQTALAQLSRSTGWYAFPGENGLKITDVIQDGLHSVATGKEQPKKALHDIGEKVQALMPK